MRRFLTAGIVTVVWTALFALSLFAQDEIPAWVEAPNFANPPFEPPPGAVITVTNGLDNLSDNGDCTLREAIQAANSDTAVDTCPAGNGADLILLPAGVYTLSLAGRSEDGNATGDLDILSTLVISGAGSADTIVDAQQTDRVLHILTGTVEIRGVTVQNGRAADGANSGCLTEGAFACPGESGGGIINLGEIILANVVVQNNRSGDGGDVWDGLGGDGGNGGGIVNEGSLKIYTSRVIGNGAGNGGDGYVSRGGAGGGILNIGILIGYDITLTSNWNGSYHSLKGTGWSRGGGGITNLGAMTITNGQILANSDGGVYNEAKAWLFDNQILGNGGRGVHNVGDAWLLASSIGQNMGGDTRGGAGIFNEGRIVLDRCAIYENRAVLAGFGGGLSNQGSAVLVNCTVSGNQSGSGHEAYGPSPPGGDGGGIFNRGNLLLEDTTIAYNRTRGPFDCGPSFLCYAPGGSGGGLANDGGAVTIHNSIIAGNSVADGGSGPDCTGIVSSQGPNLIGSDAGCTLAGAGDDILNQHAFLGPLADNGGPTLTHALLPYSLALDAGSCADLSGAPILADQRGEQRPQGAGCDLGAFESPLATIPLPETRYLPVVQNRPN